MKIMKAAVLAMGVALVGCEGPRGPEGESGSGLAAIYPCAQEMVLNNREIRVEFTVYEFADRNVMATCSVAEFERESSSVALYKADTLGAKLAPCAVVFDVDNPSAGTFNFSSSFEGHESASVKYVDRDSPFNGYEEQFVNGCPRQ